MDDFGDFGDASTVTAPAPAAAPPVPNLLSGVDDFAVAPAPSSAPPLPPLPPPVPPAVAADDDMINR